MPWVRLRLSRRTQSNSEYAQFHEERFARRFPSITDLRRPIVWVHAVSLGETRAATPLIRRILKDYPGVGVLLTHMTPTGRNAGQDIVDEFGRERVLQCYLPYDRRSYQSKFLAHFRPVVGLIMETEVWPELCEQARVQQLPLILVNARLSAKSLNQGQRWALLIRPALRSFQRFHAQSMDDAQRISQLLPQAGDLLTVSGNLKYEISINSSLLQIGRSWRKALRTVGGDQRIVLMLAVSREGEEKLFLDLWRKVDHASVLLVIVPRHPERFADVEMLAVERGLSVVRASQIKAQGQGPQFQEPGALLAGVGLLLGDTMGEMPLYYGFADAAILGGSLLPFGGQNFIEALACGCPMILGPHTFNFSQAVADAIEASAVIRVQSAQEAIDQAIGLCSNPAQRLAMVRSGLSLIQTHQGATERVIQSLLPLIGPRLDLNPLQTANQPPA